MLLAKIVISVVMVVGLTLVAEHASPRVAGVLSGYPLGAALALFFIGVENGRDFAAASAVYTLAGFSGSLVLVAVYYQVSHRWPRLNVFGASVASVLAFLLFAGLLRRVPFSLAGGAALTVTGMALAIYLFRRIGNVKVGQRVRLTIWVLIIRAAAATAIVLLITGIADRVGERWAGVLSAFPITLFPFMVILHLTYGAGQVHTVIKNFPLGIGSLVVYTATVALAYPELGIGRGTALGFIAATGYLLCLALVMAHHQASRAPKTTNP